MTGTDDRTSGKRVLLVAAALLFGTIALAWGVARHVYGLGDPDNDEKARLRQLTAAQAQQALSPQVTRSHPDAGTR